MALVILDAGHGGSNPGATYNGREEKTDTLALVLYIGKILEDNGVNVYYTRTTDIYESPIQKAQEGNVAGGDYFVSIHRNSSTYPNQYSGVQTLVFDRNADAVRLAENINEELEDVGFANLGIEQRQDLAVLRRTNMPAVLVEVGFINTDSDNRLLDQKFEEVGEAIATGILETIWQ